MSDLPLGTVTLLFTDVESSTKLVHELGDAYAGVLADHRRLVRDAVAAAGGYEVDSRGDEFFLAFQEAEAAAAAAVAFQQALAAHGWPSGVQVRVRVGLHTGCPAVRDGAYFGMDVHRAARICQAGHGGQVLLSATTRDALDGGYQLRDLGEHELPGLPEAEQSFQLDVPGLPTHFPELEF